MTVVQGASGTAIVSVTPLNGFAGTIQLQCTGSTRREFVQLHTGLDHHPRVGESFGIERGCNHVDCDHSRDDGHNAWGSGFVVRVGFLVA